jgi:hypothetical protein
MKKLVLFLSLVSLSAVSQAQRSAVFKHQVLSGHTYVLTKKENFELDVNPRDLTRDTTKVLKTIEVRSATESGSSVKTAQAVALQNLPFTATLNSYTNKTTVNGAIYLTPLNSDAIGKTVNGQIDAALKMDIDTVAATEVVKTVASTVIGNMPAQIKFPDKKMNLGDAFTQEESLTNLNIPGFDAGGTEYPMKVTYKLTAIKDNLAYFDLSSTFDVDIKKDIKGHTVAMKSKGSGEGKMVFDMGNEFPQSITSNFIMAVDVDNSPMKLAMKITITKDQHYAMNAN